jgi:hypothetical protein
MASIKFKIEGDDSPIRKILDKLKKDAASQTKMISDANIAMISSEKAKMQEVTQVTKQQIAATNQQTEAIKKRNAEESKSPARKPIISNSAAEVAAYARSKSGTGNGAVKQGFTQQGLIDEFKRLDTEQMKVTANYQAGRMSAEAYNRTISAMSAKQNELRTALQNFGKAQDATTAATGKTNAGLTQQQGILARLTAQLKTYQEQKVGQTSVEGIANANARIEQTSAEIARLNRIGKTGFDELGNAITRPIGLLERLKYAAAEYGKMSASSTNPAIIEKYNRKLQETQIEIGRVSNVGKTGFDSMGNAIKGSGNMLGKLWGGLKMAANILPGIGIAGLLAFAVGPIIEYITKLDIFSKKVSESAEKLTALNEVNRNASQAAGGQIATLKILYNAANDVTLSTQARTKAAKELQSIFPQAFAQSKTQAILNGQERDTYDELTKSILATSRAKAAKDKLDEIEAKRLEVAIQKRKIRVANQAENNRAEAKRGTTVGVENLETGEIRDVAVKGSAVDRIIKENDIRAKEALRAKDMEDKRLEQQAKFLIKYAGQENLINAIAGKPEKISGKAALAAENQYQAALAKRQGILDTIARVEDEFSRKSLTKEEEAKQAIVDRFAEVRRQLVAYNTWAANYNKNAKGGKIDLLNVGTLDGVRDAALDNLKYEQGTEQLKLALAERQQLYEDFENARSKMGEESARRQFAVESSSYLASLEKERATIAGKGTDLTPAMKDRLKVVEDLIKQEQRVQAKSFQDLLISLQGYEQERLVIQENYARDRAKLTNESDINASRFKEKEELDALDDANVQKLDAYKALYEGIDRLSDSAAKKVIADAQEMLAGLVKAGKISKDMARQIGLALNDTSGSLEQRLPARLNDLSQSLGAIASQVSGIDQGFGNMIGTLANVVGGLGQVKTILNSLKTAQADRTGSILGSLTGGLGIAGAAIGIIGGITKALSSASEREREQARYTNELQLKQTEAVTKALERQAAAIEEAFGTERLTKFNESLQSIRKSYGDLTGQLNGKYSLSGYAQIDKIIDMMNKGGKPGSFFTEIVEELAKSGNITDLGKIADGLKDITTSGQALADLQGLIDMGKLDAQTEAIASNLIRQAELYRETLNQLKAETTGTTFNEIADSIVSMFENGTTAAEDFGKNFEEIMKRSVLNSFKRNYLESALQGFYDQFANSAQSGAGLDAAEIAKLRELYDSIVANAESQFANLEKIAGVSFGTEQGKSANSLQGAYSTASQESINLLAGQTAGIRLAQLELNRMIAIQYPAIVKTAELIDRSLQYHEQIEANTRRTANNTEPIAEMRDELRAMNRKMDNNNNAAVAAGLR